MKRCIITVILFLVMTVDGAIRFKVSPSKHETNHITFVIADWMHVFYNLDGLDGPEFAVKPMNGFVDFYKNIYRPLVSRLKKYQDDESFETSLIAFHEQDVVILDDERPRVAKWQFQSYEYESKDWTFVSEWLAEYVVKIEKRTSTLVFFCKDLPPLVVKDTLNRIKENKNATVIIVSDGDIDIDGLMTEFPLAPYYDCPASDLNFGRGNCKLSMPARMDPVLNAIKNPRYNHYHFIRNTQSHAVQNTSCLQHKTICIIYKEWDIDVTTFSYFLALLEERLTTTNRTVDIQLLSYHRFRPWKTPFYDRKLRLALNNKVKHVSFTYGYGWLKARPDHVFEDSGEKNKVFLYTIRSSVYPENFINRRLRNERKQYVVLDQDDTQGQSTFRKTTTKGGYVKNIIKLNPKDLDSDVFIDLLLQAFIDLTC